MLRYTTPFGANKDMMENQCTLVLTTCLHRCKQHCNSAPEVFLWPENSSYEKYIFLTLKKINQLYVQLCFIQLEKKGFLN